MNTTSASAYNGQYMVTLTTPDRLTAPWWLADPAEPLPTPEIPDDSAPEAPPEALVLPPGPPPTDPDALELFEERAAVREFDGGFSRGEAERLAAIDVAPVPVDPGAACTRCGSAGFVDTPIHGGKSTRRDCARCNRTWGFPKWGKEA